MPEKGGKIDRTNQATALFTSLAQMPDFFQQPKATGKTLEAIAPEIDPGYSAKPMTADRVEWQGWRFEVVDLDGKRVDKVLVTRTEQPGEQE